MPTPIFFGSTRNGRLSVEDRTGFEEYLRGLDGCEIEIAVRRRRHARTVSANAWYWGIVVKLLADETGHTPEEVHEALKQRFLLDLSDPGWPRVRSTTDLSTSEFAEYCDRCVQLAAELGISVPAPGKAE